VVAQEAIQYAIGFEGYMDNLRGVSGHVVAGHLSMASLDSDSTTTRFNDQYYPSLLLSSSLSPVKNKVSLKKNMIVTGPNASGKTTLLKTTAINIVLTQQLGCGYYGEGSCLSRPYTHIHSYLNIPDTSERDSLFQAEARRCKEIIDAVNQDPTESHHFSIFDELYSGTNPKEATKAAYAFLKYLSLRPNVDFMLTTHYVGVCKKFKKNSKRVQNYQMWVIQEDVAESSLSKSTSLMKYTYRIKRGISKIEGAGQILEDMNYPTEIMGTFRQN
jgi:DNA mismatch repair protein MutS